MAILVDQTTEVIVQGITGGSGLRTVRLMQEYGTRIRGGVTPGKGGQQVAGLPVFDTVREAKARFPNLSASIVYVPRTLAKAAVFEAIDAGISLINLPAERVPQQDMLEIIAYSQREGSRVIGGNAGGIISPGKAMLGGAGGRIEFTRLAFTPGPCGVISRSGGQRTTVCYYLSQAGAGQSTAIAIGGDAFVGTTWCDLLSLFEQDPETKLVVGFGEIGSCMEEDAARLISSGGFTKPMIAYIAGRFARPDVRFGHAGAIITRGQGDALAKIQALRQAGVTVLDHLSELGAVANKVLAQVSERGRCERATAASPVVKPKNPELKNLV